MNDFGQYCTQMEARDGGGTIGGKYVISVNGRWGVVELEIDDIPFLRDRLRNLELEINSLRVEIETSELNTDKKIDEAKKEIESSLPDYDDWIREALEELGESPKIEEVDRKIEDLEGRVLEGNQKVDALESDMNANLIQVEARVREAEKKSDEVKEYAEEEIKTLNLKSDEIHAEVRKEKVDRIADVRKLEDGLTKEIAFRKEGDEASLRVIETYKVSNDSALGVIRTDIRANTTANSVTASKVDSIDAQLKVNVEELAAVRDLSASAVSKAESALTETSALATQVDSVNASIEELGKEIGNKAEADAVNKLTAKVDVLEYGVSTSASDITTLKTDVQNVNTKTSGNTSAIEELKTEQTSHGNTLTQLTTKTTSLENDMVRVDRELSAKVDGSAFNQLTVRVESTEQGLSTVSSDVTLLKSELAETNKELGKKASAQALETLETTVSDLDGKVVASSQKLLEIEAELIETGKRVDKKLDASIIEQYSTTVETDRAIADKVAEFDATLQLGSTNLLYGTGVEKSFIPSSSSTSTTWLPNVPTPMVTARLNSGKTIAIKSAPEYCITKLEQGQEYVLSFRGQGTFGTISCGVYGTSIDKTLGVIPLGSGGNKQRILKFKWEDPTAENVGIFLSTTDLNPGAWFSVRGLMLEEGTKATLTWKANQTELTATTDANARAVQRIESKVETLDGKVTANALEVTKLTASVDTLDKAVKQKADATAVASLEGKVTQQGKDITSQSTAITKLNNEVTQLTRDVEVKADASALQTLDSKVDVIDGKTTSNSSSITRLEGSVTSLETKVDKKADASVLIDYSTKIETDRAIADKVAEFDATLQLGGTNLLYGTRNRHGFNLVDSSIVFAWNEGLPTEDVKLTAVNNKLGVITTEKQRKTTLKKNKEYTLSFIVSGAKKAGGFPLLEDIQIVSSVGTSIFKLPDFQIVSGEVQAILKFVWTQNDAQKVGIRVGTLQAAKDDWVNIKSVMLEVGNKASKEWTTNPLEIEDAIIANSNAIQGVSSKVETLEGKTTANSTDITSLKSDVETNKENIKTKASAEAVSELTTRVTNTESKIESQSQSITRLDNSVTSIEVERKIIDARAAGVSPPSYYWATYPSKTVRELKYTSGFGITNTETTFVLETTTPGASGQILREAMIADGKSVFSSSKGTGTAATWNPWSVSIDSLDRNLKFKADVAALDSLETKVTQNKGNIDAQATKVTNLEATVATIDTDVKSKADATAVNDLKTQVTTNSGAISSQSTQLTKLSNDLVTINAQVETKASSTALSTLDSKVTVVDGKVTSQAMALTELESKVGNNTTNLTVQNEVIQGVKAVSAVTVNNNGYVSGYGLISELVEGRVISTFAVDANIFYVGSTSANKVKPFVISDRTHTVGGVTYPAGVFMNVATIADATITNAKIGTLDAGKITSGVIAAGRITADSISAGVIGTVHLAANAITTAKIKAGAIVADSISAGAIGTVALAARSITTDKIQAGAIVADSISANAITTDKIQAGAVTADKIEVTDLSAISADLGSIVVKTANIDNLAVTNAKLGAIDAGKITTGTLDAARIRVGPSSSFEAGYDPKTANDNAATAQKAANDAATLAGNKGEVMYGSAGPAVSKRLQQNLWIDTTGNNNTPKRWNGSSWVVVSDKAATDAKIAADNANNVVNGWKFTGTTEINGGKIKADTISSAQISAGAIIGSKILAGVITSDKLVTNKVSGMFAEFGEFVSILPDGTKTVMNGGGVRGYYPNGKPMFKLGV